MAGVVQSSPSLSVTSNAFYSGAIYVVIQQGGDGTLPTSITSTNDIIDNAASGNYSYQLFEATLSGSQFDLGDISAVNSFGFTSTYEVVYQSGSDTRGFNTSGSNIFAALPSAAVVDFSPNAFPNAEMLASGPATANNQSPWPSSGWQTYADALKNDPAAVADIQIVYSFGGSPLQAAPMLSQYGVEYVASDKYGDDYFWLVPDTSNGATNTDWIRIPASQLVQNIFVQGGSLEVHQGGKDGTVVTYDSFTPNNADGGVAKHFVAGFDAGFWGGVGTSPNADVVDTIDFNKGYNWNVNFAYNAAMLDGVGSASFINTLVPSPGSSDFTLRSVGAAIRRLLECVRIFLQRSGVGGRGQPADIVVGHRRRRQRRDHQHQPVRHRGNAGVGLCGVQPRLDRTDECLRELRRLADGQHQPDRFRLQLLGRHARCSRRTKTRRSPSKSTLRAVRRPMVTGSSS